jgi:hypothetical protein
MLFVPLGGAEVNVMVLPLTVYALPGLCGTLEIVACTCATDATGRDNVKATVDPLPLKKSTAAIKLCVVFVFPM